MSKKTILLTILIVILLGGVVVVGVYYWEKKYNAETEIINHKDSLPTVIPIIFKRGVTQKEIDTINQQMGVKSRGCVTGTCYIEIPPNLDVQKIIKRYRKLKQVEKANPEGHF